jgi:poly(beta-D-mannuronate) C5 epimerase
MIKKLVLSLFLINFSIAASCYSILTKTGPFTPVAPGYVKGEIPRYDVCKYLDETILFDSYLTYIGCGKYKSTIKKLYEKLKSQNFHFKDEKIVKHKMTSKDVYLIFPNNAHINKYYNLKEIYKKYSIKNVEKMFPKTNDKILITYVKLKHSRFLPTINAYRYSVFYKKHNFSQNVLVLYKGSITLENLYKKIHNKNIIEKRGNSYILKYPLYIAPTATLVIKNKTLLLESYPKPVFVMYHGNLFIKDSKIYAWDIQHNKFYPHPKIPDEEILMIGTQRPRPYFIGLAGSKSVFLNNVIKGLGFHDTVATFGIALLQYPNTNVFKHSSLYTFLGTRPNVTGIFIGNDIYDNMMGFYTNGAKDVVLMGNILHNNIIYDVDPHDYSKNFIIVRNITYNAHHAHGIVISRHVEDSIIAENFSFRNHSAGIMLDRLSNHNIVYKNLCLENGYMGITIQESDNVLVKDNYLIRNYIDGMIIRNSLKNTLENNYVYGNGKNGIEIFTKDLSYAIYRDFLRDPYHKATGAVLIKNTIENNYNYNLMVKNSSAIKLINNQLINVSINKNYGGDLNYFIDKIEEKKGKFTLYGRGQPYKPISTDLLKLNNASLNAAISIIRDISISPNLNAGVVLAYIYRIRKMYDFQDKELRREATNLISQALNNLGFSMLIKARKNNYRNKRYVLNALSYIIEAAIMGNKNASIDISFLPILSRVSRNDINKAFYIAKSRMQKGLLFDKNAYKSCVYCKLDDIIINLTKSHLKVFLYNLRKYNFKDFYQYTLYLKNSTTLFTKDVINSIKKNFYESNMAKIRYYRQEERRMAKAKKDYICKYYLDKTFKVNNEIKILMKRNKEKDYKRFASLINEYIDKINQFRKRKIDKNQIYKILKESNEKVFDIFSPIINE